MVMMFATCTREKVTTITPLKFNVEPENGGLEDDFPFQVGAF